MDIKSLGTHIIADLWGCEYLDDINYIENELTNAIKKSNATLLNINLHHFTPNNGVSGVALLAESHISIHTWPEIDYAAVDIFMCGDSKPEIALEHILESFKAKDTNITTIKRGQK